MSLYVFYGSVQFRVALFLFMLSYLEELRGISPLSCDCVGSALGSRNRLTATASAVAVNRFHARVMFTHTK